MLPRYIIFTNKKWMEAYHQFELKEEEYRKVVRAKHGPALQLWLRALTLFVKAFTQQTYDVPEHVQDDSRHSVWFRLDLLCLAGSTSKIALDALVVGYYTQCFMM